MMRGALQHDQMHLETQARLRGTIWMQSAVARAFYRACLILSLPLKKAGISANTITIISVLFAGFAGGAAAHSDFALAAGFVILSGVCDLLDGVVARSTNTVSRFGALLDSTMDRIADALPLLGLVVAFADSKWSVAIPTLAIVMSFAVPYVRARAEALGVILPQLFMRRAERVLLLVISLLLGELTIASVRGPLLLAGLSVLTVLSAFGAISELRAAYQLLPPPAGSRKTEPQVNRAPAPAPSRP